MDDARGKAADLGAGDIGVQSIDRSIRVAGEQAGSAVFGQRGCGAEQGGSGLRAIRGAADEQ